MGKIAPSSPECARGAPDAGTREKPWAPAAFRRPRPGGAAGWIAPRWRRVRCPIARPGARSPRPGIAEALRRLVSICCGGVAGGQPDARFGTTTEYRAGYGRGLVAPPSNLTAAGARRAPPRYDWQCVHATYCTLLQQTPRLFFGRSLRGPGPTAGQPVWWLSTACRKSKNLVGLGGPRMRASRARLRRLSGRGGKGCPHAASTRQTASYGPIDRARASDNQDVCARLGTQPSLDRHSFCLERIMKGFEAQ